MSYTNESGRGTQFHSHIICDQANHYPLCYNLSTVFFSSLVDGQIRYYARCLFHSFKDNTTVEISESEYLTFQLLES